MKTSPAASCKPFTAILTVKNGKNMLALKTAIYKVGDSNKAEDWYSKAFDTQPHFDGPDYVGFDIGGFELGRMPEKNPSVDKVESVISYGEVEKIQEAYDRMIKLGARENKRPWNAGGEIKAATVNDPFGNII